MIVETERLVRLAGDDDEQLPPEVCFPDPVVCDRELAASFLRMHVALESDATRLERDERLACWLRDLVARSSTAPRAARVLGGRDERAVRVVRDYLEDRLDRNVGLDELAAVAGIGKFRLVRLVRERTGLPPHALQLACRLQAARRRLEAGAPIAETAIATGFTDQSHLHRHFERSLGLTPGAYQRCFVTGRTAPTRTRRRPVSSAETAHRRAASSGSIACRSTPDSSAVGDPGTVSSAMSQFSQ